MLKKIVNGLWISVRHCKQLAPMMPLLKLAVERNSSDEVKAVIEAVSVPAMALIVRAQKLLSRREQIGVMLLDLTPEQQDIVVKMKEGKKFVCVDDLSK